MVQYDKFILNKLLDTYESSLLSTGENRRSIHVEFRFVKTALPAYFDESSQEYEKIHILMGNLEEKQLVEILWKGNKKGHIISKVRLNTQMLDAAYKYVQRIPQNDLEVRNRQLLEKYLSQNPAGVCRSFAEYLMERLKTHKSVKEFIRLEATEQTKQLLDTVCAVENNKKQLYVREFSIIHFQDSKAFEKMESKVAHIFRRFKEDFATMESIIHQIMFI